ncbi:alpha-tocopherol transfer protein-like [Lucilia sericata]|uniref:alpha-tocopherol transfer protein-like n=1 Tax=Lucilia sericata TaxID=13632 RepID=UPI0018A82595|nr:alpha-tocopherol transfer protein-like [Lucilia sericata]
MVNEILRVSHFYAESARDLIRRYYNLQSKYNEITNFLIPKQWNHKLISIDDVFSASTLCSELLQLEPETQINGIVYIMDMQGLTLGRALHYTPYRTKRLLDIQSNIPLRIKGFHVVNQPKIFQPIYAAAKPFFTTKFAKRIVLHGSNYESLHRYTIFRTF